MTIRAQNVLERLPKGVLTHALSFLQPKTITLFGHESRCCKVWNIPSRPVSRAAAEFFALQQVKKTFYRRMQSLFSSFYYQHPSILSNALITAHVSALVLPPERASYAPELFVARAVATFKRLQVLELPDSCKLHEKNLTLLSQLPYLHTLVSHSLPETDSVALPSVSSFTYTGEEESAVVAHIGKVFPNLTTLRYRTGNGQKVLPLLPKAQLEQLCEVEIDQFPLSEVVEGTAFDTALSHMKNLSHLTLGFRTYQWESIGVTLPRVLHHFSSLRHLTFLSSTPGNLEALSRLLGERISLAVLCCIFRGIDIQNGDFLVHTTIQTIRILPFNKPLSSQELERFFKYLVQLPQLQGVRILSDRSPEENIHALQLFKEAFRAQFPNQYELFIGNERVAKVPAIARA